MHYPFDVVEFEKMPEVIGAQPNPFIDLPVWIANYSAHLSTLTDNWEQFYKSKVSKSTAKVDRRRFKNLATVGEVRFVEVTQDDIEATVKALIQQKQVSYARMGVPDLFSRDGYCAFFQSIATNLSRLVHVTRIDVGGEMAATGMGLPFQGRYHLILSSYDERFAKHSPGRKHLHELMQHAINQKMQIFDFTIGDEPYKLDWSDTTVRLLTYVESHSATGRVVLAGKSLRYHGEVWYNRPQKLDRTKKVVKAGKRMLRRVGVVL